MLEVVNTLEGLQGLESEWRNLESCPRTRVFQAFDWCRAMWSERLSKVKGNKLWVVKWYKKDPDDVVIFPWFIDRSGNLRFIMDTSDYCDAVYALGENRCWCYREVAQLIRETPEIANVAFSKVPGDSEVLNGLGVFLGGCIVARDNAYSWLDVHVSDDFIANATYMKSKDRADLKAIRRKADKNCSLRVLSKVAGDAFPVSDVKALERIMIEKFSRGTNYLSSPMLNFIERIYEVGLMEIAVLDDAEGVRAINFILVKGSRYLSWIFLYRDPRASTELYVKYLSGKKMPSEYVFDFGVGVYSYKIGTFRPSTAVTYAMCHGKSIWRQICNFVRVNKRLAKDYFKYHFKVGHI